MTVDDGLLNGLASAPEFTLYQSIDGSPRGLTEDQAAERLSRWGENVSRREPVPGVSRRALAALRSPSVALLAPLAIVFGLLGDDRGVVTVAMVIGAAVSLRVWQHGRAARAVAVLCTAEPATATVRRRYDDGAAPLTREVPVADVVLGDVVLLQAGDVVPADVRVTSSRALEIGQSMLTGETLPVDKTAGAGQSSEDLEVTACPLLCLAGTIVVGGSATGVVIGTGSRTYSEVLHDRTSRHQRRSSVDRGVRAVGWTLVRFMLVMAPVVFVLRGVVDGQWTHAAILAVAVAVGLTPEMLPVVVTSTLTRGATRLAGRGVIVRRLDALQDLGAVEILCVDKTGTLTEDRVVYAHAVDASGCPDGYAAELAVTAAACGETIRGRFDDAIAFVAEHADIDADPRRRLVDEVPFDHRRRRASVLVTGSAAARQIICQGDADAVLSRCSSMRLLGAAVPLDESRQRAVTELVADYRSSGSQVLAVAVRDYPTHLRFHGEHDERDLQLAGFVTFVDPVRADAREAVADLAAGGTSVKMVTGDARTVAHTVATQVGIDTDGLLVGPDLDLLDDDDLHVAVRAAQVFAEVTPTQKARIVGALQADSTVVGFAGDGVNDVAALRTSDVGVASDTATDAAKHAADIVLRSPDLRALAHGVVEGRRTLGITMRYVRITASSNFGNALSVLCAGLLLPMLPILPVQLLLQNLLYDLAQLALPWDRVAPGYLSAPRRWRADGLIRFMVTFGVLSSVFDVATFAALWHWFGAAHAPATFQTGWFLEGLLTQLSIVLVLRGRSAGGLVPRPTALVVLAAAMSAAIGVALPLTPLAGVLGLRSLPLAYGLWLAIALVGYGVAVTLVKLRYFRTAPNDVP